MIFNKKLRGMNIKNMIIFVLLAIFAGLVLIKVFLFNYTPATVLPETGYRVTLRMEATGHGGEINIRAMLPPTNAHQEIFDEQVLSGPFNYSQLNSGLNRTGIWNQVNADGHQEISYSFNIISRKVSFLLPEKLPISSLNNSSNQKYLETTDLVQSGDEELVQLLTTLDIDRNSDFIEALTRIFNFVHNNIKTTGFSGKTDALTALRLQEASCNGKSRLMVGLLRTLKIPARLVGGIILNPGTKTVTHQWLEVLIGDEWVTMDPTNNHFAEMPKNYLITSYGDEAFFRRTSNVNFKYSFSIEREDFSRDSDYEGLAAHPLNIMNAWNLFQKAGLSLSLLRIILMIPIGAIVTIIFRNVIGLQTFGTFLPALIASSFRETNLLWGLVTFSMIIVTGAIIRWGVNRLKITHTPKLTILLVFVVFSLLIISASGVLVGNMQLAKATLFPLALMAITIERFSLISEETGTREALKIYGNTVITVIFCYIVITSLALQTFVLAFPETMLLVICGGLYFGNWTGMRLTEVWRFRKILFNE